MNSIVTYISRDQTGACHDLLSATEEIIGLRRLQVFIILMG